MARTIPSLSLGLALAGLLGAGAASAQSPQTPSTSGAEINNPHSPDNVKRSDDKTPRKATDAEARKSEDVNVHSTDNQDRAAAPGAGVSATGSAEAENPHSVKNKDHHGKRHHKKEAAKPMATPAPADGK